MASNVLIVDDCVAVRNVTRHYLETHGDCIICGEAADGVEAIEKAQKLSPDLIVMDLSMPRMNGLQAARILKSTAPQIPIVLFTMHANAISKCDVDLAGFRAVVSKDGLEALLAQVEIILKTR